MATEIIADRWTCLILREAFYGVVRYDDMLADLGAPRSMLTDRLAKLVKHGLMTRQPYQEDGHRTRQAYILSDTGRALGLTLIALSQWGEAHVLGQDAPVEFVEHTSGAKLKVALVDETGRSVPLAHARVRLRPK